MFTKPAHSHKKWGLQQKRTSKIAVIKNNDCALHNYLYRLDEGFERSLLSHSDRGQTTHADIQWSVVSL